MYMRIVCVYTIIILYLLKLKISHYKRNGGLTNICLIKYIDCLRNVGMFIIIIIRSVYYEMSKHN